MSTHAARQTVHWRAPAATRRKRERKLRQLPYLPSLRIEENANQGLWKSYGDKAAVRGMSLEVGAGEVLGLLGPNGAGKSTTVAMLCGHTPPDRGTVTVGGDPVGDGASPAKRRIGLVPQDISLYEDLTAIGNLELFGALYGVEEPLLLERSLAALELVGLADRAKARPSTFSGGMKRRLNIACALIHDPDVLLLDEPTAPVGADAERTLRVGRKRA